MRYSSGERLRELRIAANLKQEEVAKKLNLDQTAISHWERGCTQPLQKYRKRLAKLYNVSVAELLEEQKKEG